MTADSLRPGQCTEKIVSVHILLNSLTDRQSVRVSLSRRSVCQEHRACPNMQLYGLRHTPATQLKATLLANGYLGILHKPIVSFFALVILQTCSDSLSFSTNGNRRRHKPHPTPGTEVDSDRCLLLFHIKQIYIIFFTEFLSWWVLFAKVLCHFASVSPSYRSSGLITGKKLSVRCFSYEFAKRIVKIREAHFTNFGIIASSSFFRCYYLS